MLYRFLCSHGSAMAWLSAFALVFAAGCSGDGGDNGTAGTGGAAGTAGTAGTGGTAATGGTGGSEGDGAATLTIGEETWEFDSFGCAFGTDATGSPLFSFSSSAIGQHSGGARVQIQADIEDDTGDGRYEGAGVFYTVYITDIDDFVTPSVDWESTSREFVGRPSQGTVVLIDGNQVTAEGFFDDLTTPLDRQEVAGTLNATCGDQSIR